MKKIGVVGGGLMGSGIAEVCARVGHDVVVTEASPTAVEAARKRLEASLKRAESRGKIESAEAVLAQIKVTDDLQAMADRDIVVEAIVEEVEPKGELIARVAEACPNADLATTTSSLSIAAIAEAAGTDKLFALHVFNPVPRMKLVEVCFPDGAAGSRDKALAWCAALGKTAVEVPDQAGFVVNRLLFPYLFEAVRMIERTGMEAGEVDTCMKLGAGHPMGPLALLDFVGLDVSQAIGDALYAENGEAASQPPGMLVELVGEGKLGRKSGAGFYSYD